MYQYNRIIFFWGTCKRRESPSNLLGQGPKVAILSRELAGLEGTALFINIDSLIVSNIDSDLTNSDPKDLIAARSPFAAATGRRANRDLSHSPSVRAPVLVLARPGKIGRSNRQAVLSLRLPTAQVAEHWGDKNQVHEF